jgi:hypothetical protein
METKHIIYIILAIICLILLYYWINIYKCNIPIKNIRKPESKIYVSLTTIPERITSGKLKILLDSLAYQSLKPHIIYINIPTITLKGSVYDLEVLRNLISNYDNVQLNIVEQDLGPITKVIPVLSFVNDDDYIILVDDDMKYDRDMIKTLYDCQLDSVGFTGRKRLIYLSNVKCPLEVDFIETFDGVLYRAGLLKGLREYNDKLQESCIFQDDIKIGKFLQNNNIPRYIIPHNLKNTHDGKGTPQLRDSNLIFGNLKCYNQLW